MGKARDDIERTIELEYMLEKNRFDFPDDLSVYSILELLDTDAIIDHLAKGGVSFDEFAKAFSEAGGDLDALAYKALEERGMPNADPYDDMPSEDVHFMEYLLALICAGAGSIDIADFIECVECLDMDTKEAFYEALEAAGVPY